MKYSMKMLVIFYIGSLSYPLMAQEKEKKMATPTPGGNNIIKINLPALAFKNISIEYERKIGKKTSLAVNVHTIPFSQLPFQSLFKNIGGNSDVQYDQFKLGTFGIAPEIRFYLGKKGALRGFYIAPFFSYNDYKVSLPVKYSNNTKTGIFDGKLDATTGGLQFGTQFRLSKHLTLDWWIFGPNYGSASGLFTFTGALSSSDQSDLSTQLEQIKNDAPLNSIKSYTVSSTGASITAKGPWGGVRGLGFNLGFRF